jgi:hypothetical protein
MDSDQYPKGLPENLKGEYEKYAKDPKRYIKLHPVCYQILLKYIGATNGKKD